jgi:hypothetical protein
MVLTTRTSVRYFEIFLAFSFLVFALAVSLGLILRKENRRYDGDCGKGNGVDAFDENVDTGESGDTFRYVCAISILRMAIFVIRTRE